MPSPVEAPPAAPPRIFTRENISRARRWGLKGGWAILDQGLFAGSNFLLGIVLARWLPQQEFGIYAVAYSGFLFLGGLHTPLLTEPMLIFGASRHKEDFPAYLASLIRIHWRATGGVSACAAVVAGLLWLVNPNPLFAALAAAFLAAPFILFAWLMRRSCYVESKPWTSAGGGAVYLAALLPGLYVLFSLGRLSVEAAFAVIALASLVAGGIIRTRIAPRRAMPPVPHRRLLGEHWGYGRWALVGSGLHWVSANWYYILLPIWGGFQAAAALKVLAILITAISRVNSALGLLLLPLLVRSRESKSAFRRVMLVSLALLAVFALGYWAVLALMGGELMVWLYGERYAAYAHYLPWLGVLPVMAAVVAVFEGALRASENPRGVATVYGVTAAVTVTAGTLLVANLNLSGAVCGLLLSFGVTAVGMPVLFRQHSRACSPSWDTPAESVGRMISNQP